jgi:hypothetical protein
MAHGIVKSASIIVTDRNDAELDRISAIAKQCPDWGFGIHLTLTNEYQNAHPWHAVLPKELVPTLYNNAGFAWSSTKEVEAHVNPAHASLEFEAQIEKAYKHGINLSHIDSHMGTYYLTSSYPNASASGLQKAAINAAEQFDLPLTINTFKKTLEESIKAIDRKGIIRPETLFGFYELEEINTHLSYQGSIVKKWLTQKIARLLFDFDLPYKNHNNVTQDSELRLQIAQSAIRNILKPGLNHVYMHAAKDPALNQSPIPSTANHPEGIDRIVRLSDTNIWNSLEIRDLLDKGNIQPINYQVLRDLQRSRRQSQNKAH